MMIHVWNLTHKFTHNAWYPFETRMSRDVGELAKYFWVSGKNGGEERSWSIDGSVTFPSPALLLLKYFVHFPVFCSSQPLEQIRQGSSVATIWGGEPCHRCHFAFFYINLASKTGAKPGNAGQNLLAMILNLGQKAGGNFHFFRHILSCTAKTSTHMVKKNVGQFNHSLWPSFAQQNIFDELNWFLRYHQI